jgi:arabinofuranosyltransferase
MQKNNLMPHQYKLFIALLSFTSILLLSGVAAHFLYGYGYGESPTFLSAHAWGNDDAYISYRYAQNLLDGHGLVYNVGERVEGYSNFLYVLIVAAGLFFFNNAYIVATVINCCCILLSLIIFSSYIARRFSLIHGFSASLLFATLPQLWLWTSSGMEPVMVMLTQLMLWICVEKIVIDESSKTARYLLWLLMLVSVLLRADGFIPPFLCCAYLFIKDRKKPATSSLIFLISVIAGYVLWRYNYYGYPLPNTYYVKITGSLVQRLYGAKHQLELLCESSFMVYGCLLIGGIALSLFSISKSTKVRLSDYISFDIFFIIGWLGYWSYIGGDVYQERFLIVLPPLIIAFFFQSFFKLIKSKKLIFVICCVGVFFQIKLINNDLRFAYGITHWEPKYDFWIDLGEFLKAKYPNKKLAIDGAGKVPFFSALPIIDMLGINDLVIGHKPTTFGGLPGHDKTDPDYVFSRRPHLIAAWVINDNLDLLWGLSRSQYTSNGYFLKYLVNSGPNRLTQNIVDATLLNSYTIQSMISGNYKYAILERRDN